MRITVASSGLGHVSRGIEGWASDLARALARRGMAVTLCKGGGAVEADYERIVPCLRRGSARAQWLARNLPRGAWRLGLGSAFGVEQMTFALALLGRLRRQRADVLHVQEPLIALVVQTANRLGLVPTRVILGHGTEEPLDFIRRIRFLQHLAPWHLEQARNAGVWKPTWTAIPNFVDTDEFRPARPGAAAIRKELGIPAEAIVVLTSAAIKREHKRIDYLLGEFARLRAAKPALPVWLVVAGGRDVDTDSLIEDGNRTLGERVRFLVRFPRDRMADLYAAADLFALCSLKEMMPLALVEAAASGLPCIVHQHPVLESIVGPGGELIDMAQPGRLADRLSTLSENEDARIKRGKIARSHCSSHFGRDAVVDQIVRYYEFVRSYGRNPASRGDAASSHAKRRKCLRVEGLPCNLHGGNGQQLHRSFVGS